MNSYFTYLLNYLLTHSLHFLLTYSLTQLLHFLLTYLLISLLTHLMNYLLNYLLKYLLTYSLHFLLTYLLTSVTYSHTFFFTYLTGFLKNRFSRPQIFIFVGFTNHPLRMILSPHMYFIILKMRQLDGHPGDSSGHWPRLKSVPPSRQLAGRVEAPPQLPVADAQGGVRPPVSAPLRPHVPAGPDRAGQAVSVRRLPHPVVQHGQVEARGVAGAAPGPGDRVWHAAAQGDLPETDVHGDETDFCPQEERWWL